MAGEGKNGEALWYGRRENLKNPQRRQKRFEPETLGREIDRFFDQAGTEGRLVLPEDLLRYLGLTDEEWEALRAGGKSARRCELSRIAAGAEQRLTSIIIHAAAENPRLTSLAVHLTKQRLYGCRAERAEPQTMRGVPEVVVKLEGASEPFD